MMSKGGNRKFLNVEHLKVICLDDADDIYKKGFLEDLDDIFYLVYSGRSGGKE